MQPPFYKLISIFCLVLSMISIQLGLSLSKNVFDVLGVQGIATARILGAALIMSWLLRIWRVRLDWASGRYLFCYGASLAGMIILFYYAMARIPQGIAVAIEFLGPLTVTVLYSRQIKDLMWVGIAMTGLLLVTPLTSPVDDLDAVGLLWAFGAAICWGVYIVSGKSAGKHYGMQTPALGMVIAALISIPFGAEEFFSANLTPGVVGIALLIAIISGVIPFTLEMVALRQLPVKTFATLLSFEPVVGMMSGWMILHETLAMEQILAVLLIVIACAGAACTEQEEQQTPVKQEPA